MNDQKPLSFLSDMRVDEETSITGKKSVSEIIKLLRTKANLKTVKGGNDIIIEEDLPRKSNLSFPWMAHFITSCREILKDRTIKELDGLVTTFHKNIEECVKSGSIKPKRAFIVRKHMDTWLMFFHMVYQGIKKPLEHTSYLDKMGDIMSLYIDMELKASRRGREHPKKITHRICSSLFLFLDNSIEHILDSVLKSKFFIIKRYSDICHPVMARLLRDSPGKVYETNYVRYLLTFKLWKKLAGKEHGVTINKEAISKLKPPPNFADKVKSGVFSNILPYVSKSDKDRITSFLMKSPFNVKEKAELFLKEGRKVQPSQDLEKDFLFDENFKMSNLYDSLPKKDEGPIDSMNEVWNTLMEKESDPLEELFDCQIVDDNERILSDLKKSRCKEKVKKDSKNRSNDVVKSSIKKRKPLKGGTCLSVKKLLAKESAELNRTDKPKPIIIPIISKDESSFLSRVMVEDSFKKEDKKTLQMSSSPEPVKKPCAAVEPEQSKEQCPVPDSQNRGALSTALTMATHSEMRQSSVCRLAEEISMSSHNECIRSTVIIESETSHEAVPSHLADSSGICEEIKVETESNDCFMIDQDIKESEILQDQIVAEEVVIGTEISNDEVCTTYLIMEHDGEDDHNDIMSVIDIVKEPCTDLVETSKENRLGNPPSKNGVNFFESQSDSLNNKNQPNGNSKKEQSSILPGNKFLPSKAPYQSNVDCPLDRRQDSYTYNNIMLTRLFSEVNADEGSDEENRYHNNSQYAGGGKVQAFQKQMDESKSDIGEDFESPSPASRSDSQKSMVATSPEMNNSQVIPLYTHDSHDCDRGGKNYSSAPVRSELLIQSNVNFGEKLLPIDSPQLRDVSTFTTTVITNGLSAFVIGKEKIHPKGMCQPPDNLLHFKTVDDDSKFHDLQRQLYTLYNTTQNILDTDPVPYPPTVVVSSPINGYVRCPCTHCDTSFASLDSNYRILFGTRSNRVCQEIDKKRLLSKMYLEIDKTKMANDKLLKSIEDSIPDNGLPEGVQETGIEVNKDLIPQTVKHDPPRKELETDSQTSQLDTMTSANENLTEAKSEYSSLPPKKRKAFSLQPVFEENSSSKNQCNSTDVPDTVGTKKAKVVLEDRTSLCQHIKLNTVSKGNDILPNDIEVSRTPKIMTRECNVVIEKYSPVKIKAVEGKYCVLTESSERVDHGQSINEEKPPNKEGNSKHDKCHKHRKKSKEEKRLKKERKRLKKMMKEDQLK